MGSAGKVNSLPDSLDDRTRELWDALLSCDSNAVQEAISNDGEQESSKAAVETLVPTNFLWCSEVKDELSALHYVSMIGDVDLLYDLIWRFERLHLDLQSPYFRWTPLHFAIYGGHERIVRLLLGNRVATDTKDKDGVTALHLATSGGHLGILELLLLHQPKINIQDDKGDTPLHVCLGLLSKTSKGISEKVRYRMVDRLLRTGASVALMNNLGDTAMHYCLKHRHSADLCRLLLSVPDAKSSLKVTNDMGQIPLHVAEEVETLELLLLCGSHIDFQAPDGRTALHMRATKPELITLLLDYKADVNITDKQGRTALHVALCDDMAPLESICHLLMSMCDVNMQDIVGNAPLHLACCYKRRETKTSRDDNDPIVDLLINQGACVNMRNKSGETPLFIAVRHTHYKQASELLSAGASPYLDDNKGNTPVSIDPRWAAKVQKSQRYLSKDKNALTSNSTPGTTCTNSTPVNSANHAYEGSSSIGTKPNLDKLWESSKGKTLGHTNGNSSENDRHQEKFTNSHSTNGNKMGLVSKTSQNGLSNNKYVTKSRMKSMLRGNGHVGGVKSVKKQLASLQGEVASFKSILEKCADPNAELSDSDLLALLDEDGTRGDGRHESAVPEEMSYLTDEVLNLAQELEDVYLDS